MGTPREYPEGHHDMGAMLFRLAADLTEAAGRAHVCGYLLAAGQPDEAVRKLHELVPLLHRLSGVQLTQKKVRPS